MLEILKNASDSVSFLHRNITDVDFTKLTIEEKDEMKTLLQNIVSLLEFLSQHENEIK